jgi:hypothetical protein
MRALGREATAPGHVSAIDPKSFARAVARIAESGTAAG